MAPVVRLVVVFATLYVVGRIMYQGRSPKTRWRLFHVVLEFFLVMAGNAVVMAAIVALFALACRWLAPLGLPWTLVLTEDGRLSGGNLMLAIFLLVFVSAIVQYAVRALLDDRWHWLLMGDDEYQIFEYFIQWLTIFCVVYQCIFEGFADLGTSVDVRQAFEIALAPDNINLVLQPLLLSSWITVVMERFARKNAPRRGHVTRRRARKATKAPSKAPVEGDDARGD